MATDRYGGTIIEALDEENTPPLTDKYGGTIISEAPEQQAQQQVGQPEESMFSQVNTGLPLEGEAAGGLLNVAGQVASGANQGFIGFADLLAKAGQISAGGYKALGTLATTGDLNAAVAQLEQSPQPSVSDAIDRMLATIVDPSLDSPIDRPGEGRYIEDDLFYNLANSFGNVFGPGVMGLKSVAGRDITRSAGQAAELLGAGSAAGPATNVADGLPAVVDDVPISAAPDAAPVVDDIARLPPEMSQKLRRELALKRGQGDVAGVGYRLDDAGNVIRDKADDLPVKKGWGQGLVAMFKGANAATRKQADRMLEIAQRGKENLNVKMEVAPGDVIGEVMDKRVSFLRNLNRKSGAMLEEAVEGLEGKRVDVSDAYRNFLERLKKEGVSASDSGALSYKESSLRGSPDAQKILDDVVEYLRETPESHDALSVHRLKRFIDEQVTYGKTTGGLSGQTEFYVKSLRREVDAVLDAAFPEYNKANTIYSSTIEALDEIQSLTGTRVDLLGDYSEKALGIMSRKALSNYAANTRVRGVLDSINDVVTRWGDEFDAPAGIMDENIKQLVQAEADIRNTIPGVAQSNTLQAITDSSVTKGVNMAEAAADLSTGSPVGAMRAAAKVFGGKKPPTDADHVKQMQALRDWLAAQDAN